MDKMLFFLAKSMAVSFVLMVNYWVFLRNRKFHQYNRIYLLALIVLSFLVPLCSFSFNTGETNENSSINKMIGLVNAHPAWLMIVAGFAAAISCLLLLLLVMRIARLYRIKANHPNKTGNGFILIETCLEQAPFSFFNNLYWKKNMPMDDDEGKKILQHELTHIREKHTYDKLFASLVSCICWFNPVYRMIQNELTMVHEFIADENSIDPGDTNSFAAMLLSSYGGGRYLDPVHSFYHSPVKRRLTMIAREKTTSFQIGKMAVLPALVVALICCSFKLAPNHAVLQKQYDEKRVAEKAAMNSRSNK